MSTPEETAPAGRARPAVLVADNDAGVGALLSAVLRGAGMRASVVADGREVLERLRETEVDLLVCDLDMPGMHGLEVLRRLAREASPPPVFVVTGYLDAETGAALAGLAFVREVFEKPFDVRAFSSAARAAVGPRAAASDGGEGV